MSSFSFSWLPTTIFLFLSSSFFFFGEGLELSFNFLETGELEIPFFSILSDLLKGLLDLFLPPVVLVPEGVDVA